MLSKGSFREGVCYRIRGTEDISLSLAPKSRTVRTNPPGIRLNRGISALQVASNTQAIEPDIGTITLHSLFAYRNMWMPYFPDIQTFSQLASGHTMVPVYRQLVGDTLTPVTAFGKLNANDLRLSV